MVEVHAKDKELPEHGANCLQSTIWQMDGIHVGFLLKIPAKQLPAVAPHRLALGLGVKSRGGGCSAKVNAIQHQAIT